MRGDGEGYTVSPSRIKTLLNGCSEQFAHEYVWGTPRSRALVANMGGSAIHYAAEVGEKAPMPYHTLAKDEAMEGYRAAFDESLDEALANHDPEIELKASGKATNKWPEGNTVQRWREELRDIYLGRYYDLRRDVADSGWESMGAEVVLTGVSGSEVMRGYADLVLNDGGEPVIVDIKTGSTILSLTETQLLSYCWMLDQAGIPARRAEFWWLYGASFDTQRIVYEFTDAQLATIDQRIAAFAARRDSGIFYPEPSRLCPSCAFQASCGWFRGTTTGAKGGRADGEAAQTPSPDPFVGIR